MWKQVKKFLEKNEALIIILCLAAVARIPSLFEPYWYGDEAIYLTIGQAMRAGVPLYSGIHDNKPPFLYIATAIAGGNQFWFKFLALGWVLVTVAVFYKLAEKVFGDGKRRNLATGIFAFLVCWPKLEGNIANAELFFLLPTLVAATLLWTKPTMKAVLAAGLCLGLGALFKMPAMLEAGVWPVIWLWSKDRQWWRKSLVLAAGTLIPIGLSMGYFGLAGSLKEYFTAAWSQNLPYLSSWKAAGGEKGIFSLNGRAVAVMIWIGGLLVISKKSEQRFRIVGVWAAVGLFAALLSGRPYPHYLVQAAGVAAICAVLVIAGSRRERGLGIIVAMAILVTSVVFKFYDYPVIGYYRNFGEWMTGKKSLTEYYDWFGGGVNNNYKISEIIKSGSVPGDKIFVWGDEPVIYALSKRMPTGKYTVKYHIRDFGAENETMTALMNKPPKFIVDMSRQEKLPGLEGLLNSQYREVATVGQAVIYRISIYN